MNKLTVKTARATAQIVSSGYSDRYPMPKNLTVFIEIATNESCYDIKISAFSWEDAAQQLTSIAETIGDNTTESEFRQQISSNYELILPYRDDCKSSTVKTNSSTIRDAITFYTKHFLSYTEEGKQRIEEATKKVSREELLGIKNQMDALNALIKAGLQRGEIVEFNWKDK